METSEKGKMVKNVDFFFLFFCAFFLKEFD